MTCVIGIQEKEGCYIAADSATADEHFSDVTLAPKLFTPAHATDFIIGGTDSWRMLQVLQFGLICGDLIKAPVEAGIANLMPYQIARERFDCRTEFEYIARFFVEAIRKLFKDAGYATVKDGVDTGGTFLVAFRGCLYLIQKDFQVSQYKSDLYACGSGFYYALGAMQMARHIYMERKTLLTKTLEATSAYQPAYVRPPYIVRFQARPEE